MTFIKKEKPDCVKPDCVYGIKYSRNIINFLIFIIDSCNYSCNYCYNIFPRTNIKLDLDYLYQYFSFLLEKTNKKLEIEFIGGEPTLHPELFKLCKKLNNDRCFNKIYTNLSQNIDLYKKYLDENVQLITSWHSIPDDHFNLNFITKLKELKKFQKYFKQLDIRIMYEINHTSQAINTFQNITKIFNIDQIEFSLLVDKMYNSTTNNELYKYSNKQLIDFYNCVNKLNQSKSKKEYIFKYKNGNIEYKCFNDLFGKNLYSFKNYLCDASMTNIYIHFDGNVYPCVDYFTSNVKPLFNIYNRKYKIYSHPILCKLEQCSCDWSIKKQKIFNG